MKSKRFWLLLKVQLKDAFLPPPEEEKPERPQKGGFGRKRAKSSGKGYLVALAIAWIIIVAFVTFFMIGIAGGLRMLGLLDLLPLIGVVGASVFVLITTAYKTKGLLFGFKDYDLVMSLPFRMTDVVACRVIILYLWNFMFAASVMLPAGCVYAVYAQAPVAFWPVFIIEMLLAPLLPIILAVLIGMLIAYISTYFTRSGFAGTIITIVAMLAWMIFVFNMNDEDALQSFVAVGPQIYATLSAIYPPAAWFVQGCCSLNMGYFALFSGVSVAAFGLFVWIVGRHFRQVNASLTANRKREHFAMTSLEVSSQAKALRNREWKRLFGSSTYFMNSCMGYILTIVVSAIVLIAGPAGMFSSFAELGNEIGTSDISLWITMFVGFFVVISAPTVASISLEGNTLWIIKSLPVSSWNVLKSKLDIALILTIITAASCGTMLWIAFPDNGWSVLLGYAIVLSYGCYSALMGQWLDLKYADFTWTNEVKVVKQGKPAMIMSLSGIALALIPFFLTMFFGIIIPVIMVCFFTIICIVLYRLLRTRGVETFSSFTA